MFDFSSLLNVCAPRFVICFMRCALVQVSQRYCLISSVSARHTLVRKVGWDLTESYVNSRVRHKQGNYKEDSEMILTVALMDSLVIFVICAQYSPEAKASFLSMGWKGCCCLAGRKALRLLRARCCSLVVEKVLWEAEDAHELVGRGCDIIAWLSAIGPKL